MTPNISEFSYGYALTEALVSMAGGRLRAAPVFPSLLEEGLPGGGYDVKIPFPGFPLFLQFKLSHKMVRSSAEEVKHNLFYPPFFRFHLRPTRHSQQHPMLLELEQSGEAVYYAAPKFYESDDLNDAYASGTIVQRSVFLRPSQIGVLPDDKDHHVSFQEAGPMYFCSSHPRLIIEGGRTDESFVVDLAEGEGRRQYREPSQESIEVLADKLQDIVERHNPYLRYAKAGLEPIRQRRAPATRLAFLSYTYLGCGVMWVSTAPKSEA